MLIEEKYFTQDKNTLLKSVQAFSKESLLNDWIEEILKAYNYQHNPMGLEDDFIIELRKKLVRGKELLQDNYDILAAIYRYDHADNQLEFQWDGRTHMEVFDADWKAMYTHWITQLSMIKEIQRPIVRYSVSDQSFDHTFLKQSIRRGMLSHFKIRLRGTKLYRAA